MATSDTVTRTLSVRLPRRTVARLQHAATADGTTVNGLLNRLIEQHLARRGEGERADVGLADFLGCLASDGAPDARQAEEDFGALLRRKHAGRRAGC